MTTCTEPRTRPLDPGSPCRGHQEHPQHRASRDVPAFRAGGILAGSQGFIPTAVRGPHLRQPQGAGGGRFGGLLAGQGTFCVGPFKDGKDTPFHAEDDDSGGGGGGETQAQALGRVGGTGLSVDGGRT